MPIPSTWVSYVLSALLLAAASTASAAPGIRLQGQLSSAAGQPISGATGLTVRMYGASAGGTPLYTEVFNLAVQNGVIEVLVGAGQGTTSDDLVLALSPQSGEVGFERYLAMQIEGDDAELSPRRRLAAAPFSTYTLNAASLGGQPADAYATLVALGQQLQGYATTTSLQGYATTASLQGYATTASLQGYATTASLQGYATTSALQGYATTSALQSYATTQLLQDYVTNQQLQSYATTQQLQSYATTVQLQSYATTQQLGSYVRVDAVTQQNVSSPITYLPGSAVTFAAAPGSAPFVVQSQTMVANLNAERLDGVSADQLARTDIDNIFYGNQLLQGTARFEGAVTFAGAPSSAPFAVQSSVMVPNLNAALVGGQSAAAFARVGATNTFSTSQSFGAGATFAGQATFSSSAGFNGNTAFTGPVTFAATPTFNTGGTFAGAATFNVAPTFNTAPGNAPFVVQSTTQVDNLNASLLNGKTAAQILSEAGGGGGSCATCTDAAALGGALAALYPRLDQASVFTGAPTFGATQGTVPFTVTSTTVVPNLNAGLLGGHASSYYTTASNLASGTVPDAVLPASLVRSSGAVTPFVDGYLALRSSVGQSVATLHCAATAARDITFADVSGTVVTTGNLLAITALPGLTTPITTAQGGLGVSTAAAQAGAVLYASGPGAWAILAKGTDGQVLKLQGGVPAWGTDNTGGGGGGGTITSIAGGTGLAVSGSTNPITSSGTLSIDPTVVPRLGSPNVFTGAQAVKTGGPAVGLAVEADATQGAINLQEWRASGGAVLSAVTPAGGFTGNAATATTAATATSANALRGVAVSAAPPSLSQVLRYDGSQWAPIALSINLASEVSGALSLASGGTGAGNAASARQNLLAAASGVNGDITALSGLTTPITPAQGGLGVSTASAQAGAVLYASGPGAWAVLPKGTDGQVLKLQSGVPAWGTDNTGGGGGGGTITSVTAGTGLAVSGSTNPITSSGTLSVDTLVIPRLASANVFTAAQSVAGSAAGSVPLTLTGAAAQTASLQEWKANGVALPLASISASGAVTATSFSGLGSALTALSADNVSSGTLADARLSANVVTVSTPQLIAGAKTFADGAVALRSSGLVSTTLHGTAATLARDIAFPDANGTVLTTGNLLSITQTGVISSGTWQGTVIATGYGGLGQDTSAAPRGAVLYKNAGGLWQSLLPGSVGQVLKTGGAGADPSWQADATGAGSVQSITQGTGITLSPSPLQTTGTIAIDTSTVPLLSASNTFTGAQALQPSAASGIPLTVKGASGQTADLQRWLSGAGATVGSVSAAGAVVATSFTGSGAGLGSLSADNLVSGTVADARLPANLVRTDAAQNFTAAQTFFDTFLQLRNAANTASTTLRTVAGSNNVLTLPNVPSGTVLTNQNIADLGVLPISQGGLGQDTTAAARGAVLYKNVAGVWTSLAPGTSGNVLRTSGPAADPTWGPVVTSVTAGTGLLAGGVAGGSITGTGTLSIDTATVPSLTGNNTFGGNNIFSALGTATFQGASAFNNSVVMTAVNNAATPLTINATAGQASALISLNGVASQSSALLSLNATATHTGNLLDIKAGASSLLTVHRTSGVTLQNFASGTTPLVVKGASGQTVNLLDVQTNLGASVLKIDKDGLTTLGNVNASTLSATGGTLSGLTNLAMLSGTLTVPAAATMSVAGNAVLSAGVNLGAATLTGTLNAASNLGGGTYTSATHAGGVLSGTFDASAVTVNGGTFDGIRLNNPSFTGTVTGATSALRYAGNLLNGCDYDPVANTIKSGTTTCHTATEGRKRCSALSAACKACCVENLAASVSGAQSSIRVPIAKFTYDRNGTHTFALNHAIACLQYYFPIVASPVVYTINGAVTFCNNTLNDCTNRPPTVDSTSTAFSPYTVAGTASTFLFKDTVSYSMAAADFTLSTVDPAERQVIYQMTMSFGSGNLYTDPVNQPYTNCYLVKKNTVNTTTFDPYLRIQYEPTQAMSFATF